MFGSSSTMSRRGMPHYTSRWRRIDRMKRFLALALLVAACRTPPLEIADATAPDAAGATAGVTPSPADSPAAGIAPPGQEPANATPTARREMRIPEGPAVFI